MTKIPVVSSKDTIKVLRKIGFVITRQKGSHVMLRKVTPEKTIKLVVPLHRELKKGTLKRILNIADLSVEDFLHLLRD